MKQCNKEKNILIHRFVYACVCDDVTFTTLNAFGVLHKYEQVTNNLACVLRTFQDIVYRLFGHTPARTAYPRHPCSSTFTCFEIQEQHIIPKVNTFTQKRYW